MKKSIIALLAAASVLLSCKSTITEPWYTNIVIENTSNQDSVLVYVTLQAPNSVVGMFGITDTVNSCSKGTFYAHKGIRYSTNLSGPLLGAVITFSGDNLPCQDAVPAGFPSGINIFECSINTGYEVFDISCVDGVNSEMRVTVSDTVNWTTGDGDNIQNFRAAANRLLLKENNNIRGVFPYMCTDCKDTVPPVPQNCFNLPINCSTNRTCQVARTDNNGGTITLEYRGDLRICK